LDVIIRTSAGSTAASSAHGTELSVSAVQLILGTDSPLGTRIVIL